MGIVNSHRVLYGMECAGFIKRDGTSKDRVRHWSGAMVPVITADAGPKLEYWAQIFTYEGKEYRLKYFEGCFSPFVVEVDTDLPPFV